MFTTDDFKTWMERNEEELREIYEEYVHGDNDSLSAKDLRLTKDGCFIEWCEERYEVKKAEMIEQITEHNKTDW